MEQLPVFDAMLDGPETGVNEIAFVKDPAIMIKGIAFASQAPKERIAAPILIPMNIYRYNENDGEYEVRFTASEIENIVKDFQQKSKTAAFNLEHNTGVIAPAYLLESWLVGENTQADRSYSEFGVEVPAGTWFGVAQITDTKFFNQLVDNEQTSFSIEGTLGLIIKQYKQTKQIMTKQFKLSDVPLADGASLFVDGDIAVGTAVFYITSTGDKVIPADDTTLQLANGQSITVMDGVIAEISTVAEEASDSEIDATISKPTTQVTMAEPIVPEVTPVIPDVVPSITVDDVNKLIDEKVSQLITKIAELQTTIDSIVPAEKPKDSTPVQMTVVERYNAFLSAKR